MVKAAVLGAAGQIGSPFSLLLKMVSSTHFEGFRGVTSDG